MAVLEFLLFVLLSLFGHLNLSFGGKTNERCQPAFCQPLQPSIRFPFMLKDRQNENCAYPGFELSCNSNGNTVIQLPLSGEFLVDFIHYRQQAIWLKDPKDCLPQRLPNFSASGSTLRVAHYTNFTFLNCSADSEPLPGLSHVKCLSGKGYNVMVLPTEELFGIDPNSVQGGCLDTWTMNVPSVPKDLSSSRNVETIGLKWDQPDCGNCEELHGTCGLKNEKSREVGCSFPSEGKRSKLGTIIAVMTPWILLTVVSCYISKKRKARDHPAALTLPPSPEQGQQGQVTSPAIIGMDSFSSTLGVDSPTIASYSKIQITENTTKLLEPMGHNTCAICLLEYLMNDTVKIIPECNHHFHDHCIDQWLRKKATCPLCRKQQHRRQLQDE